MDRKPVTLTPEQATELANACEMVLMDLAYYIKKLPEDDASSLQDTFDQMDTALVSFYEAGATPNYMYDPEIEPSIDTILAARNIGIEIDL